MTHTCPACRLVADLTAHRDNHHPTWGPRRATLNFALVLAARACPLYQPATINARAHKESA